MTLKSSETQMKLVESPLKPIAYKSYLKYIKIDFKLLKLFPVVYRKLKKVL